MLCSLAASALALAGSPQVVEDARPKNNHWAVLIAGSAGYGNYRHQADVCHAYQIVTKAGMNPDQVIVLAVDDIANNRENPYPGQLFNKPTPAGTPGVDVYAGCKIDYSGSAVTPETFVKVLTGDKAGLVGVGSGKVLESDADSRVFVNFVDHGGVGLIGFPRGVMHAKDLIAALTKMHTTSMYKELVFYLEACESGSMFENLLPPDINIYATSAANSKESSWGTYCSPNDKVDGKSLHSCLGDLYSVNWMEDSDVSLGKGETLSDQFETVKALTNKSHVMEWGATELKSQRTSNFQGVTDVANMFGQMRRVVDPETLATRSASAMRSRDAELASAYTRFMETDSEEAARELIAGVQDRLKAKKIFEKVALAVTGRRVTGTRPARLSLECHYAAHKAYVAKCGEWTVGALPHSASLAELCAATDGDERPIVAAITEACSA